MQCIYIYTGRTGRMSRARFSRAGDLEFNSRPSQTNDLKLLSSLLPRQVLGIITVAQGLVGSVQDYVTKWDIRSWSFQPGIPV